MPVVHEEVAEIIRNACPEIHVIVGLPNEQKEEMESIENNAKDIADTFMNIKNLFESLERSLESGDISRFEYNSRLLEITKLLKPISEQVKIKMEEVRDLLKS